MYTSKENVNILISLLVSHHVYSAVVCPGSRNAPIVHNLNECPDITCYPVTDERSAGFFAIGLIQATQMPVAVCVTSGSALLNLAPAVAEAKYQQLPLVVISADRPQAWIDQLDGQTIPQPGALAPWVRRSVSLPEPHDEESRWLCNRLVNEALLDLCFLSCAPVHINVPISEPLFEFSVEVLPYERVIRRNDVSPDKNILMARDFFEAERPMIVLGQEFSWWAADDDDGEYAQCLDFLADYGVVLSESLNNHLSHHVATEKAITLIGDDPDFLPDVIIYIGGHVVSKRLKRLLRRATEATVYMVNDDPALHDVTMHMDEIVVASSHDVLVGTLHYYYRHNRLGLIFPAIDDERADEPLFKVNPAHAAFHDRWQKVLDKAEKMTESYEPAYSQMATVRYFEEQLYDMEYDFHVHYGNSSAIRLANIYAAHHVWCNRGVNGIEGSLSTAAGFAAYLLGEDCDDKVFCVLGDLSFFYDQNALWNANLGGNLRIILLNNGGGGIFRTLPGLENSDARDRMVAACHETSAQGICTQCDIGYLRSTNMEEMQMGVVRLLTEETNRPMLLEVFTNADIDYRMLTGFYEDKGR